MASFGRKAVLTLTGLNGSFLLRLSKSYRSARHNNVAISDCQRTTTFLPFLAAAATANSEYPFNSSPKPILLRGQLIGLGIGHKRRTLHPCVDVVYFDG